MPLRRKPRKRERICPFSPEDVALVKILRGRMMLSPEDDRLVRWTTRTIEEIRHDRQSLDYLTDPDR